MKLSNSTKYALMAAGYIASHPEDGNIKAPTISQEYNIPSEFLLKILQQLCRAGILQGKRGPRGGYVAGRDPSEITLLQIIEAIDGSASNFNFAEQTKNEPFALRMTTICEKAEIEQNKILSKSTLAEIIRR